MNLKEQKKIFTNVLVVSGTGRNTGKTTFICRLIEKFKELNCIAIKISSHFHELPDYTVFIENSKRYQIVEEKNPRGFKDSQKMLAAGAKKVFYVQSEDEYLPEVIEQLSLNEQDPIIFESGAIAKYLPDALHICVTGDNKYKPCRQPNFVIDITSESMDNYIDSIKFKNNKFSIYDIT